MTEFTFYNDEDIKVTYKTDLIGLANGSENFTVMEIEGLDSDPENLGEDEEAIFSQFQKLPFTVTAFREFAEEMDYSLIALEIGGNAEPIILNTQTPPPTPTPSVTPTPTPTVTPSGA